MKPRTSLVVIVVCIAVLMLTLGVPTAAARGTAAPAGSSAGHHTIVIWPTGSDDTANIQSAFTTCTAHGWTCTIQLVQGTYYTDQITANGFHGSFVGAGQARTVVQALPNLPAPAPSYNTASTPFWAGAPGTSDPWPVLFTFVNGAFSVSGLTFTEPYLAPISAPWYGNLDVPFPATTSQSLYAVVLVTGEHADVAFDHVTVLGSAGDLTIPAGTPSSFNLESGIVYEGMFLPSGWSDFFADQIPLGGTFVMTNSLINTAFATFYFQNLLDASVAVYHNSLVSGPATQFIDVSNSQLVIFGNSFTNSASYAAFGGLQSFFKTNLLPSTVYVEDNYFGLNWEGSGPVFFDFGGAYGLDATLTAVVTGNVIVSDMSCGCYTYEVSSVTLSYSLVSAVFSGNLIEGGGDGVAVNNMAPAPNNGPVVVSGNIVIGADVGISVFAANGVHVTGNVIKNSGSYGVWVFGSANDTLVAHNLVQGSGLYDLYWDQTGTGNAWIGNVCQTSSPSGLC